jgi:carbon monoxide dehydrogenase subunit G
MKIENEFTVDAPIQEVWNVLMDLERVTPCLPGAALTEQAGDEYKGTMSVKLGPISQEYEGTVKIDRADEDARQAVLKADGKDARGQGTVSGTITSTLHEENGGTRVQVETDVQVTGRAAQFGRGMMQDVAEKLAGQFADCLENEIMGIKEEPEQPDASEAEPSADGAAEEESQPHRRIIQQDREVEPLDLSEASRGAVLKRVKQAAPVAAGIGALIVVALLLRRRT